MKKLGRDRTVAKRTKNHGITIPYVTEAGNVRGYHPDFLIKRVDGQKELHEVKGGQYLQNPDTRFGSTRRRRAGAGSRGITFVVVTKSPGPLSLPCGGAHR